MNDRQSQVTKSNSDYNPLEALMFQGHKLTPIIHNETGEPWFLGKEVAEILEISNLSQAIKNADLEEDESTIILNESGVGGSKMTILSESGLYGLIGNSRKQAGKELRRFVRKEVLPSIRKTGGFQLPSDPQEQALFLAHNLIEAQKIIEAQKPAVEFAKQIAAAQNSVKVGEFAKMLYGENLLIGQNRLFAWLYAKKYLKDRSTPYQKYMDMGIFEVVSGSIKESTTGRIWKMVKITGKGVVYLTQKILESGDFEPVKTKGMK